MFDVFFLTVHGRDQKYGNLFTQNLGQIQVAVSFSFVGYSQMDWYYGTCTYLYRYLFKGTESQKILMTFEQCGGRFICLGSEQFCQIWIRYCSYTDYTDIKKDLIIFSKESANSTYV